MSKMSRTKGQVGEREVALELSRLTGQCIRRRVRNAAGDSDLEGLSQMVGGSQAPPKRFTF